MPVALREVFRFSIILDPPLVVGEVPGGVRRVIPIVGGSISGDLLRGEILPIGADWNLARDDGTIFLSARYMFRTDDGVLISLLNEGWSRMDEGGMHALMAGAPLDQASWYTVTHPRFEAPSGKYDWLNKTVFVCEMLPPPNPAIVPLVFYEVSKACPLASS